LGKNRFSLTHCQINQQIHVMNIKTGRKMEMLNLPQFARTSKRLWLHWGLALVHWAGQTDLASVLGSITTALQGGKVRKGNMRQTAHNAILGLQNAKLTDSIAETLLLTPK